MKHELQAFVDNKLTARAQKEAELIEKVNELNEQLKLTNGKLVQFQVEKVKSDLKGTDPVVTQYLTTEATKFSPNLNALGHPQDTKTVIQNEAAVIAATENLKVVEKIADALTNAKTKEEASQLKSALKGHVAKVKEVSFKEVEPAAENVLKTVKKQMETAVDAVKTPEGLSKGNPEQQDAKISELIRRFSKSKSLVDFMLIWSARSSVGDKVKKSIDKCAQSYKEYLSSNIDEQLDNIRSTRARINSDYPDYAETLNEIVDPLIHYKRKADPNNVEETIQELHTIDKMLSLNMSNIINHKIAVEKLNKTSTKPAKTPKAIAVKGADSTKAAEDAASAAKAAKAAEDAASAAKAAKAAEDAASAAKAAKAAEDAASAAKAAKAAEDAASAAKAAKAAEDAASAAKAAKAAQDAAKAAKAAKAAEDAANAAKAAKAAEDAASAAKAAKAAEDAASAAKAAKAAEEAASAAKVAKAAEEAASAAKKASNPVGSPKPTGKSLGYAKLPTLATNASVAPAAVKVASPPAAKASPKQKSPKQATKPKTKRKTEAERLLEGQVKPLNKTRR